MHSFFYMWQIDEHRLKCEPLDKSSVLNKLTICKFLTDFAKFNAIQTVYDQFKQDTS